MGNIASRFRSGGDAEQSDSSVIGNASRKRKLDDSSDSDANALAILNTPKRKRIKSTSKYIYQTLFLDSEGSDVTIKALDKDWKLHKLYLQQCDYFSSMFSGPWKESTMDTIEINILDENITEESLRIAFGSLYKDDVFIKPVQVIGVLAAATLLQMEGLIQQCRLMMQDTLNCLTVGVYHKACSEYGLEDMRKNCFDWLTRNLLVSNKFRYLKDISIELMTEIIQSAKLNVMQVEIDIYTVLKKSAKLNVMQAEIDIYTVLKKWVFMCCNPTWDELPPYLDKDVDKFFEDAVDEEVDECFLELEPHRKFIPAFGAIRWHHVVTDSTSINMLESEKVLPLSWLEPVFMYSYRRVLHVDEGHDKGPIGDVDEEIFDAACSRCGRILIRSGEYCWRWTGYSYGVDLLVSFGRKLVTVKRNTQVETCPKSVSLVPQRHLCYRMTIWSYDECSKVTYHKTTGIKKIVLGKDEENIAFVMEKKLEYPLVVSMNVMLLSPEPELPIPKLEVLDS